MNDLGMLFKTKYIVLVVLFSLNLSGGTSIKDNELTDEFDAASDKLHLFSQSSGRLCKGQDWYSSEQEHGSRHQNVSSCSVVYQMCFSVMESLHCIAIDNNSTNNTTTNSATLAEIYGYGTIMILSISLLSLLGVIIVPLLKTQNRIGKIIYKYTLTLMIAMGASALLCNVLFDLLPTIFGVHHGHGHLHVAHDDDDHDDDHLKSYVWKSCTVIAGIFFLYLFELILQRITEAVAHKKPQGQRQVKDNVPLIENEENVSIRDYENTCCGKYFSFGRVRPLAWIILCGDFVHNIADAITIGAAVSQSLTLGLTTTIAIALHELPHELADYAILLKCGMHWGTALMFNFLSSLLAAMGFFIGAAISTSVDASDWLLAIAAGSFFYIALVDLLPELLNGHSHSHDHEQSSNGTVEKKPMSCGDHVLHNIVICIGFFISFVVLLLLSLFEDKINDLFH